VFEIFIVASKQSQACIGFSNSFAFFVIKMGNSLKAMLFFEAIEEGNLAEVTRLHEKEQAGFDLRKKDEVRFNTWSCV
jgi:uncharacterized membrane protein